VPSVRPHTPRLAALAGAAVLLAGCSTTQEKAAEHQAEAKRILEKREKRQRKKLADGPKTGHIGLKSAHRPEEGER
jgi:hypothetical protein